MINNNTIGKILGKNAKGDEIIVYVDQVDNSIYLRTSDYRHLIHPSISYGGKDAWAREAIEFFKVKDAIYHD